LDFGDEMSYQAVRGTRDIFGVDLEIFDFIETTSKSLFIKKRQNLLLTKK